MLLLFYRWSINSFIILFRETKHFPRSKHNTTIARKKKLPFTGKNNWCRHWLWCHLPLCCEQFQLGIISIFQNRVNAIQVHKIERSPLKSHGGVLYGTFSVDFHWAKWKVHAWVAFQYSDYSGRERLYRLLVIMEQISYTGYSSRQRLNCLVIVGWRG